MWGLLGLGADTAGGLDQPGLECDQVQRYLGES